MRPSLVVTLCILFSGCTKHNPHACTAEGKCNEPTLPFCDVQGTLGGDKNECIAVTCTPGEFAECRDNVEVRCDENGTNYSVTACERVCESSLGGCRLCDANESACTNSTFATCDANGTVVASTKCGLGCFDATRCKEISASNGLSTYRDMVAHPPDLDLSAGAHIDTLSGTIAGLAIAVPTFLVPAPPNGVAIRVFIANNVRLGDLPLNEYQPMNTSNPRPALAIIATGDIEVTGRIDLGPLDVDGNRPDVPGQLNAVAGCSGVDGQTYLTQPAMNTLTSGGGGGGHATNGADGGSLSGALVVMGSGPGLAIGTAALEPLRGGCNGGSSYMSGGGAIQLTSNSAIRITGTINVSGAGGQRPNGGGGAGGAILLEAPVVEVGDTGKLIALGGGGASRDHRGQTSSDGTKALGGTCDATTTNCGRGGDGATATEQATRGEDQVVPGDTPTSAGGGGGGAGRIRINTQTGTVTQSSSAVVAGVVSTGTIAVR